jgi:hypothetical protein
VPIFLDSNNLSNLDALFTEGIHKSEVVVLLATKDVLTRPYCLLELYEGHKHKLPIVVLQLDKGGFDLTSAMELVSNIETELERVNPGALAQVQGHLMRTGSSLAHFKECLLTLVSSIASSQSKKLTWHPWGSDNMMIADAKDVVGAIAAATNRSIRWRGSTSATGSRRTSWSLRGAGSQSYAMFVSYYRAEAGSNARLLHNQLEIVKGQRVFIDASYANNVAGGVGADEIRDILEQGLARSKALVLLQTKECFTRPWVLLELFEATQKQIPIIPVHLEGAGYDFGEAKNILGRSRDNSREFQSRRQKGDRELPGHASCANPSFCGLHGRKGGSAGSHQAHLHLIRS